jgi:ABC-type transport system involved in multi-copper enzyme maturation permease subunit
MAATATSRPSPAAQFRVVLRSEVVKLRTVRSTIWTLAAAIVSNVAVAALLAIFLPGHLTAHQKATIDSVRVSLGGLHLSQIAVGLLGVLAITGEYSTGMIRATLSAVPKRFPVWVAKIVIFTVAIFAITLVAAFIAFLGGQAVLSAYQIHGIFLPGPNGGTGFGPGSGGAVHSLGVSISHPGAVRAIFGAALYMVGVGLLGLGCGFIIRNTGGAIAALFGLLLVLPLLAQALPSSLQQHVSKYLPLLAGTAGMNTVRSTDQLSAWAGLGVFALYVAAALGIGLYVLRRRDA